MFWSVPRYPGRSREPFKGSQAGGRDAIELYVFCPCSSKDAVICGLASVGFAAKRNCDRHTASAWAAPCFVSGLASASKGTAAMPEKVHLSQVDLRRLSSHVSNVTFLAVNWGSRARLSSRLRWHAECCTSMTRQASKTAASEV